MSDNLHSTNVELVRSMSQNFVAGRLDAVKVHIADEMIMTLPDGLPYGGVYRGWDGYLAVVTALGNYWSEVSFAPPQYLGAADKVVVLTAIKGKTRDGRSIEMPLAEIWEVHGGLVDKITAFYFDTKAI
jgi:ketosteroid isomerase-like protein